MPEEEACAKCHRVITAGEDAFVHQNEILCRKCYRAISAWGVDRFISELGICKYHKLLPLICFAAGILTWILGLLILAWSIDNVNFDFLLPESTGLRAILLFLHIAIWFGAGLVFEVAGSVLRSLKGISAKLGQTDQL